MNDDHLLIMTKDEYVELCRNGTIGVADKMQDEIDRLQAERDQEAKGAMELLHECRRLRAELAQAEKDYTELTGAYENASVEAERLRAENAKLRDDIAAHLNTILYLQMEAIRAKKEEL